MSLSFIDVEVLMKSGRPQDRIHACLVMGVFLFPFLFSAAKLFPVVKNQHLLLCTLLICNSLAMEILPQAVCARYGMAVEAMFAPLERLLLWVFFPVAYLISKMLGKGHSVLLHRAELKTFVDFHGNEAGKGGDLTHDETTIIPGALELTEKTAKDAMTAIPKAFSLSLDGSLNLWVYFMSNMLVKNLLMVDPDEDVPIRGMMIRKIPRHA
ncbi:CNNM, transmembrane domain [Dillenia turbinata]|uniref:CNNM, transmembrane domain n=1 Tax=Dillenia turbinata TaxID=194707 RepID=A0AAN8UPG6_9MAGN